MEVGRSDLLRGDRKGLAMYGAMYGEMLKSLLFKALLCVTELVARHPVRVPSMGATSEQGD